MARGAAARHGDAAAAGARAVLAPLRHPQPQPRQVRCGRLLWCRAAARCVVLWRVHLTPRLYTAQYRHKQYKQCTASSPALLPPRPASPSCRRLGMTALLDPAALMQLQMAQRKPEVRWLAGAPRGTFRTQHRGGGATQGAAAWAAPPVSTRRGACLVLARVRGHEWCAHLCPGDWPRPPQPACITSAHLPPPCLPSLTPRPRRGGPLGGCCQRQCVHAGGPAGTGGGG